MSNSILEEKWKRWYPRKTFLKHTKKNKRTLYDSDKFKKEDFLVDLISSQNLVSNNTCKTEVDFTKTKEYKIGFEKGLLQGKEENILLQKKLNNLFLNFEKALFIFENALYSQLLKTVLKISSYVIGKKIDFDESVLINYIKKIIDKDGIFLKKPQLIVHSNNKKLIENIFKEFLSTYKWTVISDDSIDLNGCKIRSESTDIDATAHARWEELCRLINSEEY